MSEFGGEPGPHGIDKRKTSVNLSATDKLRLGYTAGVEDPTAPVDPKRHAWNGTTAEFYEKFE
jgi:hypothetical protein